MGKGKGKKNQWVQTMGKEGGGKHYSQDEEKTQVFAGNIGGGVEKN